MKLIFAGDFCPLDGYDAEFSPALRALFSQVDYSFVNLECPLTDSTQMIEKCGPNLKASSKQIGVLQDLGANCVTLANNHILDFCGKGVIDTQDLCRMNAIKTVGAGANIDAARKPLILNKDGIGIAVLNVAEKEFCIAGKNSPGANPLDLINIIRDLEYARKLVDKIIIVVHGGLEHVPYPSPESVRVLRFLAEQTSVIAVIRHHPHVVQGSETWNGVPIYYSLGNFYFPYGVRHSEGWYKGLVVRVNIDACQVSVDHVAVEFDKMQPGGSKIGVKLNSGGELPSFDEYTLDKQWERELKKRRVSYYSGVFLPWAFASKVAEKLRLFNFLPPSQSKCRLVQNIVRCDAHREVLVNVMKGARWE